MLQLLKMGGKFKVEVAEKWEVVIKVGWEFETKVVKKWEVAVKVGGWFTVEVVLRMGGEFKAEVVEKWEVDQSKCGIYSRSGGGNGKRWSKQMGHLLGI
jgi:hypothetical protein